MLFQPAAPARDGRDRREIKRRHQVKVAINRGFNRGELTLEMISAIALVTSRRNGRAPSHTARIDHRIIHAPIRAESHERVIPHTGQFLAAFSTFG